MKKLSKRLLSALLAALFVFTSIPMASITAMADDTLESKMTEFVTLVTNYANGDHSKFYDGLPQAYEAYVNAYKATQTEDTSDDASALSALTTALSNVKQKDAVSANYAPKFGTGTSQPTSDDYANIIYSDGEKATKSTDWLANGNGRIGAVSLNYTFMNTVAIYYPNTVALYDGKTQPKIPVIAGVTGGHTNDAMDYRQSKPVRIQSIYIGTGNLNLVGQWRGSTVGDYNGKSEKDNGITTFTTPSWNPVTKDNSSYTELGISDVYDVTDANGNKRSWKKNDNDPASEDKKAEECPFYSTDVWGTYQVYNNSLLYAPDQGFSSGLDTIDTTTWAATSVFQPRVATAKSLIKVGSNEAQNIGSRDWTNNFRADNGTAVVNEGIDGNDIYVLNYKKLLDAVDTCISNNKPYFTREYLNEGGLTPIFAAIDKAADFDPSSYSYSNDVVAAAKQAGSDIDSISAELENVIPDAVNVQAEYLSSIIKAYEDKMNSGNVYTNLRPAYHAYINARGYLDAYKYGNKRDFGEDIDVTTGKAKTKTLKEVANDLNVETNKMLNTTAEYGAKSNKAFQGDNSTIVHSEKYNETFNGLAYSGTLPTVSKKDNVDWESDYPYVQQNVVLTGYNRSGSYTRTFFFVPYTVAVYDGDAGETMTTPILLGFATPNFSTSVSDAKTRYLYNCFILPDENLKLKSNWKTKVYASEQSDCPNISLEECLNGEKEIAGDSTTTGTVSEPRSDNATKQDDQMEMYANTLIIGKPNFNTANATEDMVDPSSETNANFDVSGYLYHYTKIETGWRSSGENSDANDTSKGDHVATKGGTYGGVSYSDNNVSTTGGISIYVVNYEPVKKILDNNASLLTKKDFDISKYVEGGLDTYFKELDTITTLDPRNYDYTSDYATASYTCAQNIKKFITNTTLDATTKPEENEALKITEDSATTGDPDAEESSDDGVYTKLNRELENANAELETCYAPKLWEKFENALTDARQEIINVSLLKTASSGDLDINGYDKKAETVESIVLATKNLQDAEAKMKDPNYMGHPYKYVSEDSSEKAKFDCDAVENHEEVNGVDMSVYNEAKIVYDMLDKTALNDSGKAVLANGKTSYDNVKATASPRIFKTIARTEGFLNDSDRSADTYEQGVQTYVDDGIADLITAMNEAIINDTNEKLDDKTVTFRVSVDGVVADTAVSTTTAKIGRTVTLNAEDYAAFPAGQKVYRWEIKTESSDRTFTTRSNTLVIPIQSDCTVTAYVETAPTADEGVVTVKDLFNKVWGEYNVTANDTITFGSGDTVNTITIGSQTVSISNTSAYSVNGWKVGTKDYTGQTVKASDIASDLKSGIVITPIVKNNEYIFDENAKYTVTLDGVEVVKDVDYDYRLNVNANADDTYAIGVRTSDGRIVPAAYGNKYTFYVTDNFEFVTIHKNADTGAYSYTYNGTTTAISDKNDLFMLDRKLPFVYSFTKQVNKDGTKYTTYNAFTTNSSAEITECGTLFTKSANASDLTVDNVDNTSIFKVQNKKRIAFSNQFQLSAKGQVGDNISTRAYVKFTYSYTNKNNNTAETVNSIVYGNAVSTLYTAAE